MAKSVQSSYCDSSCLLGVVRFSVKDQDEPTLLGLHYSLFSFSDINIVFFWGGRCASEDAINWGR